MMQFHKLDSRRLRVTDLPSTVEGLRVDATELEVIVSYVGDPSGRKAIVLDNVVNPLMFAAPELLAACRMALDYFNETRSGREWRDNGGEEVAVLREAIDKALSMEVNA